MATVSPGSPVRVRVQRTAPVAPSKSVIEWPATATTDPSEPTATCRTRSPPGTVARQTGAHASAPHPATANAVSVDESGA